MLRLLDGTSPRFRSRGTLEFTALVREVWVHQDTAQRFSQYESVWQRPICSPMLAHRLLSPLGHANERRADRPLRAQNMKREQRPRIRRLH
jgi:hypothetical protein